MKRGWIPIIGVCLVLSFSACKQLLPYQDASLTAEQRAEDLLPRLTLEEKVSIMQNASPAIPRLGIKEYEWWNEALHGVGRAGLATVFPQSIGMGASFNDSLLYEVFNATSDEARVKSRIFGESGVLKRYQGLTFWTPNVNIFRDPRWGRGQETYGEDPYLTGQMGMAVVRGLQGPEDAGYDKLHACAKHFAVHSGPEWNRHSFDAENIDPRDLWETYLPAFKDLVQKAHVKEVMCAYNRFEGEPCCGSNRLLMQILRDEWGYKGIVVSDCGAISDFYRPGTHGTHPDKEHASAAAVRAGTDLECGSEYASLADAVKAGLIDEKEIDISLKRLLTARFELGEMDEQSAWSEIPTSVLNSKEHQALALCMARESLVLLQNKNNILPLNTNLKVAVMGPNANDSVMQWGNYNGIPAHTVTLLEAVRAKLPEGQIIYEPGCDRVDGKTLQSLFDECSINGKPGFLAEYWNNRDREGEVVTTDQISTPFHFATTGATTFAPGVEITNFSARYESVFRPSQSGDVAFRFQLDGEVTLIINGEQVAQKIYVKNPTNLYTLQAKAGKEYHIEILFKQRNERATLDFDLGKEVGIDLNLAVKRVMDADVILFAGGISPTLEDKKSGKKLFYPRVVRSGNVDSAQLSKEIAAYSSLSPGDVKNTLDNLVTVMGQHLQSSESVSVDGLGTFRMVMVARGKGVETSDEVSAAQATLTVRFQPTTTKNHDRTTATRSMVTGAKCARYDKLVSDAGSAGGGNSGGSDKPGGGGNEGGGEAPDPAA